MTLTKRQREIYDFLKDRIQNRGYGPTVREIGDHFGIKSPNGVMCHLKALERKGLITRESNMSRAICLSENGHGRFSVPFIGTAVSGGAVKSAVSSDDQLTFSAVFQGEDKACIKVSGSCFTPLCILDGDCIIVSKTAEGEVGGLLAALDDRHSVTLYRVQPDGRPPIPAIAGVFVTGTRQILGAVVAIVRQFPTACPTIPEMATAEDTADSEVDEPAIHSSYAAPAMV